MTTPKPTAKPNPIRLVILGALLDTGRTALARNMSLENVDRLAERWLR